MKTSAKNEYKCQVELKVELNADEMKEIVKDVERAFVREARLPGFRPGKVPIEIIRKQFADGLKQETEHTMIRKHYATRSRLLTLRTSRSLPTAACSRPLSR